MQHPALSILITNTPYLSDMHLHFQIDALNRQTCRDFQVFYLNQDPDPAPLQSALQGALFPHRTLALPFPWLADTCCWEMVATTGQLLAQPVHGRWWTYLHKECLPAPDFVATLLTGMQAAEAEYGSNCIYRLNQLRCEQTVNDLNALYPAQLASSEPVYWIARTPFEARYVYQQRPWEEDAFAMPVALTRQSGLFAAVQVPLFFQDLFDIFYLLPELPFFRQVKFVHLGQPVIYHLNHPRIFNEYRQAFLKAVREHPELFGHLALYELAQEPFDYSEGFEQGERIVPAQLHRFVRYMRFGPQGTVMLWLQSLQRYLLSQGPYTPDSEGLC